MSGASSASSHDRLANLFLAHRAAERSREGNRRTRYALNSVCQIIGNPKLAHQQAPFKTIEPVWGGEGVHVIRGDGVVTVDRVSAADIILLDQLAVEATILSAAEAMLTAFPDADLPAIFARLLRRGALMLSDISKNPL